MDYIKSGVSFIRRTYNNINPATLSGAIDIIVCEDEDGNLVTSPFHVRFGKQAVLSPKEKVINISVNGERVEEIQMKLGEQGEAFFVTETQNDEQVRSSSSWSKNVLPFQVPFSYVTSPMPTSPISSRPATPGKPPEGTRRHHRRKKHHRRRSLDLDRSGANSDSEDSEVAPEIDMFDPELWVYNC